MSSPSTEFVSSFFWTLSKALDMKLHFTSGYHPEGDGQTKRTNQTLEQYLQVYCNYQQDNWSELLPLTEFAYNNAPNATTGITPFFANKGYHPNISVHLERDLASLRARDFVVDLNEFHLQLCKTISAAQTHYSVSANKHRTPSPKETRYLSSLTTFAPLDHLRNLWRSTSDPSKLLLRQVPTRSPFVYPAVCAQSTRFSMSPC